MIVYRKGVINWQYMALLSLTLGVSTDASASRFGTLCQQDFENSWNEYREEAWKHCEKFNNELDNTDAKLFYHDLHGAKLYIEETYDQLYPETVDLFYIATHGSVTSDGNASRWSMWDEQTRAFSTAMRLGDEAAGLSILASWACHTHQKSDGKLITRLRNIFRGGLKYSVGSHGTLHHGRDTNECGEEFADNLQDGEKIKYAWRDALQEPWVENDAIAVATGETDSECGNRRDTMTWRDYWLPRRLRDGNVVWYCWSAWENL